MSSRSPRAADDLARAEEALERHRERDGIQFKSAASALGFFFEKGPLLASPTGVRFDALRIDGGPPSDPHEVRAAVIVIGDALKALHVDHPQAAFAVHQRYAKGKSQRQIADKLAVGTATASALIGRGEAYVAGWLSWSGLLRRRERPEAA